ncbi:tetraacyldisaccharide 4'-kinase [Maribacter chungangensis]|uniref:Tetraacyldisaccharide 4'-kinase n=1 Tax=Maribacter chungangensis TaxID=1069117 RepID=A0ABW3B6J1_9FLAO
MQLLRKLLFPISVMYALVVVVRNWLYDIGIFKSQTFSTTTICVGNLSVGGTGKTPMTEFLIRIMAPRYKVAMLSRGYKRKSTGFVLANKKTTVGEIGDEPFQIFSKFPEITVAVDAHRQHGIERLEQEIKPDVILLDDAFQHRKVSPSYSILLTTYDNLYMEDWYLPTGDLRDAKYAARRANCIVVTKCPVTLKQEEQAVIKKKIDPKEHQTVLFAYLTYAERVIGKDGSVFLSFFQDKQLSLVTGIADPKPLTTYLKRNNIGFEHLAYGDHHFFTKNELEVLKKKPYVLTTEKDYVRLKDDLDNLWYIPVSHSFLGNGEVILEQALEGLMTR